MEFRSLLARHATFIGDKRTRDTSELTRGSSRQGPGSQESNPEKNPGAVPGAVLGAVTGAVLGAVTGAVFLPVLYAPLA